SDRAREFAPPRCRTPPRAVDWLPMRIEPLILAVVAALASGCPSTWNCDPPSEDFTVDATLTEAELARIVELWGFDDRAAIECEAACDFAYARDCCWASCGIRSCPLTLCVPPGGIPEGQGATITCEGRGIQYYCEGRRPLGHVEHAVAGDALG